MRMIPFKALAFIRSCRLGVGIGGEIVHEFPWEHFKTAGEAQYRGQSRLA